MPSRKQPKILQAFKLSYQTLSKHVYLLLFPIFLDLFFLFGKRLLISDWATRWVDKVVIPPAASTDVATAWAEISLELLQLLANFSLTGFLRSYPIGVPSLLAFRPMASNPFGAFQTSQVQSSGQIVLLILIFSLIGFVLGSAFLILNGMAVKGQSIKDSLIDLKSRLLALFIIPMLSLAVFTVIFIPALLVISIISSLIPLFGSIGYFVLSLVLISRITPLIFTPHDIILFDRPFNLATKESVKTVLPTNGKTSFFLLLAFFATYASNLLWQVAKEDSWIMGVSIMGHAIVTTLIFLASFHFYIDARTSVLESTKGEAETPQPTI